MAKHTELEQVIVGEWYRPTKKHTEVCCGCGLRHELQYKVDDGGDLWIKVIRVRQPRRKAARATR